MLHAIPLDGAANCLVKPPPRSPLQPLLRLRDGKTQSFGLVGRLGVTTIDPFARAPARDSAGHDVPHGTSAIRTRTEVPALAELLAVRRGNGDSRAQRQIAAERLDDVL